MRRRPVSFTVDRQSSLAGSPRLSGGKTSGRKLPSLDGVGLERLREDELQRQIVRDLRRAGLLVVPIPNQHAIPAPGMVAGASDLLVQWDMEKGAPGNRGICWIELKRPVKPSPVTPEQDAFIADQRALGVVAGVAQSYEQAEALLVEAGAPLRFHVLRPALAAGPHENEDARSLVGDAGVQARAQRS